MFRRTARAAQRWWDALRRGPEIRRLIHRIEKLEKLSKDSRAERSVRQAALKRARSEHRRRILDPDIVRGLLADRLSTVAARALRADARSWDLRLEAASAAYREAVAGLHAPSDGLVRTTLDGLTWWVPIHPTVKGAARERFVAKQRFPYRSITQTREFSVGPVMLDIGANMGRMSIPRVILGDFVQAYCAEPDPLNYAALVRNVVDNGLRGLVLPDRVAIGAESGVARLRHAKYSGGHRLVTEEDAANTIEVPCSRLDDWCERMAIDPQLVTYVKVDTQGWEMGVLRGASCLLSHRHIAWQLEISPALLTAAGASAGELYDLCCSRFTHFVDLGKTAEGPRARPTADLGIALAYLGDDEQTDIVLFNAAEGSLSAADANG